MESNPKSSCMFLYYKNALSPPPFPILLIFKSKRVISVRGQWHICNCQVTFYEWKAFSAQFSFSLQMWPSKTMAERRKIRANPLMPTKTFFWARCWGEGGGTCHLWTAEFIRSWRSWISNNRNYHKTTRYTTSVPSPSTAIVFIHRDRIILETNLDSSKESKKKKRKEKSPGPLEKIQIDTRNATKSAISHKVNVSRSL